MTDAQNGFSKRPDGSSAAQSSENSVSSKSRGRRRLDPRAFEIAERLSQARINSARTIAEAAEAVGLKPSQYAYLERACGPAHESKLPVLAELFGVPFTSLADVSAPVTSHAVHRAEVRALSAFEARALGARARSRRDEIALSRNELCSLVSGLFPHSLLLYEKSLPRRRTKYEDQWEDALQVPHGWLRNIDLQANAPPAFELPMNASTASDEIAAVFTWIARKGLYRRTLDYGSLDATERRAVVIMCRRYGLSGERASTLQSIADELDLTRERVRQIGEEMLATMRNLELPLPALIQIGEVVSDLLPCRVDELDKQLSSLLGGELSIVAADRFSRDILGRGLIKLMTKQPHQAAMAIRDEEIVADDLRGVRQAALSMIRAQGAAQIHYVAGMASSLLGHGVMPDDALRLLRIYSTFEWLNEDDGWFWFGPANDNRAKTTAIKVLSVATRRVDIEELHDAMSRARLTRYNDRVKPPNVDVPASVLQQVISRIPGVEVVQFNDFRLAEPIAIEDVLSDTEMSLLRSMRAHGGVATRRELVEEVLRDLDVSTMAVHLAICHSPIFVRLDYGIWTIRGCAVDSKAFAKASASVATGGSNKFINDFDAPTDGWWRLKVSAPESAFTHRHWLVPAIVRDLLQPDSYVVEGYATPAILLEGTNLNMTGFVPKLIDKGIMHNELFYLYVHESEKRLRIEKLPAECSGDDM